MPDRSKRWVKGKGVKGKESREQNQKRKNGRNAAAGNTHTKKS